MAITHVNSFTGGGFSGGVNQITVTGCQVDDYIVVGAGWGFSETVTLTSVADADGTYSVPQNLANAGHGRTISAYHKCTSSGTHTVSVTVSTNPAFGVAVAHLVRGVDTSTPLDNSVSLNGTGSTTANSATSGALTPSVNGCYLFGWGFDCDGNGLTATAGTDFTRAPTGGTDAWGEYYIQPTAGSHAATFTLSGNTSNVAVHLVILKPVTGGNSSSVSPSVSPSPSASVSPSASASPSASQSPSSSVSPSPVPIVVMERVVYDYEEYS